MGWSDGDMLDACMHGSQMISAGIMFKAFKMGEGAGC
jgi:hypothetical protein